MATGLEVFGAACALVQLIQFSFTVAAGCKKYHDGEPTDDTVLAAYVHDMHENLILVQRRFQLLEPSEESPPAEKELQTVAKRCQDTARELQTELSYVTKKQQRNDYASAIAYMFRSLLRRGKIERLRRRLDMEKGLMENRLLIRICSQNDAKDLLDDHRFMSLEKHVQSMIIQISKGHYKLRALISEEHKITREIIIQESANTRQTVKYFITSESQRKEFLESLRFPEMKKRYNDLRGSGEVSFDRVFASYESMNSTEMATRFNEATIESLEAETSTDMFLRSMEDDRDIDSTWSVFKQWLTTSHPLFCIQGKPGSGKSTLSKFIIDNPNTKSLLTQWNPQSTFLSHFFWKIGATSQNSIKGLLCSLVYQLLANNESLQEQVMKHQIRASYKYYDDWSSGDLKNIFRYITETHRYHIFIFIDGIDEIGNSDGIPNLIQVIEELFSFPQIKVCVSSRPDLSVTGWLKKHNAKHILLENLTKYEMARFALRELGSFVSSAKLSLLASKRFTTIIVERSKGVFLWVYLVLRSVTIGIQNGDPEELLLERLEALPSELEDLYSEMWRRMGEHSHVYQKVAARYFHYILYGGSTCLNLAWGPASLHQLSLKNSGQMVLPILCAENPRFQDFLLGPMNDEEYNVVGQLYQETKERIEHKCAGLLQVCPRPVPQNAVSEVRAAAVWYHQVEFIHRTAHDFLIDTEQGQKILSLHNKSPAETRFVLFKASLVASCIYFYKHGGRANLGHFITELQNLYERLEPSREIEKQDLIKLASIMKRLYENDVVGLLVSWKPKREFLSLLTPYPCFHAFIISELSDMPLSSAATETLQTTCQTTVIRRWATNHPCKKEFIKSLVSTGAQPHVFGIRPSTSVLTTSPFAYKTSSFLNLLHSVVKVSCEKRQPEEAFAMWALPTLLDMSATCPDLEATILSSFLFDDGQIDIGAWFSMRDGYIWDPDRVFIVIEVRLSFLVAYAVSRLRPYAKEISTVVRIEGLLAGIGASLPIFRYICHRNGTNFICERVINGSSCRELTDTLFQVHVAEQNIIISSNEESNHGKALQRIVWSLIRRLTLERVEFEDIMLSLTERGLNVSTLAQLGIIPTIEWLEGMEDSFLFPKTLKKLRELSGEVTKASCNSK